jgi:ribosomal protein S18 acetylase RimI-like enzyme
MLKATEVEYLRVPADTARYAAAIRLREEVLRIPLGRQFSDEFLSRQRLPEFQHFAALMDDVVIAAATARVADGRIQIFQVATVDGLRSRGIGSGLMLFLENCLASETGIPDYFVFSRLAAVNFYERLGYSVVDDRIHMLAGLEHREMSKCYQIEGVRN